MLRRLIATLVLGGALAVVAAAPVAGARPEDPVSRSGAWCAGAQSWTTARASVGEWIRVRGKVVSSSYASKATGRPTFLDIGKRYPNPNRLTVLIWGRDRSMFPSAPERFFRGKTVCVQGQVRLYRGVPQITVSIWDADLRLMSG